MDTQRTARRLGVMPALLLALPLLVALVMGVGGLDAAAYETLYCVDRWARAGIWPCRVGEGPAALSSPLFAAGLFLPARAGLDLRWIALVAGALGWGAAALLLDRLGHALGRPNAGTAAALALGVSPVVVATLGTPVAWTVAAALLALAATVTRRRRVQAAALVLMVGFHLDLGTLTFALVLLGVTWAGARRYPRGPGLALTAALAAWLGLTAMGWFSPAPPRLAVAPWSGRLLRLLDESDFYWLALLPVAAGLVALARRDRVAAVSLVWLAAVGLDGGAVSAAAVGVVGLALAGLGLAVLVRRLARAGIPDAAGAPGRAALAALILLPLAVAQGTSLAARHPASGTSHQQLEARAAAWLRDHSPPDAVVLGSARLGYLAGRTVEIWPDERYGAGLDRRMARLEAQPPDYSVAVNSLAWDDLLHAGWFRDVYIPVATLTSPYTGTSPFTIWARRPRTFELGDYRPLSVRLPGSVYWVGTRYVPDRIEPGATISVTLFLHEPQPSPAAVLPFRTALHLGAPDGSGSVAELEAAALRDVVLDEPGLGRITAERFELATPGDLDVGAYVLAASILTEDIDRSGFIYEGTSPIPIDRVTLGYVVVPWQGSLAGVTRVGAVLGERIALVGYEVEADPDLGLVPGAPLTVQLYWEARRPLGDYKPVTYVFVHLLDAGGGLVTQHDGPPAGGRYPLQAWIPGEVVRDAHPLVLPADMPPGTYRLQVGMYTWPDLDRLPAQDRTGAVLPDGVVVLGEVAVE
jgi:hypothetical protein